MGHRLLTKSREISLLMTTEIRIFSYIFLCLLLFGAGMTCKTLGYIEKCLVMLAEDRERYNRLFETGFNLPVAKQDSVPSGTITLTADEFDAIAYYPSDHDSRILDEIAGPIQEHLIKTGRPHGDRRLSYSPVKDPKNRRRFDSRDENSPREDEPMSSNM